MTFATINTGYNQVFKPGQLSLGLVVPIENHGYKPAPTMEDHIKRIQLAECLGFASVWLRDIPFNVPSFGDVGHLFDPFVYLGLLAGQTQKIALGVSSIILPLRHPAHTAKAAASVDAISNGRLILGIASGDRPEEYPAMNLSFDNRGEAFRENYDYIRQMGNDFPIFDNAYGKLNGQADMLPKPTSGKLPLLITGGSQQSNDWIASHGDGWMLYPRNAEIQANIIASWREKIKTFGRNDQPVMEPLYIDLVDNHDAPAQPIHLGLRLGTNTLIAYLKERQHIGVNHIALNLRFNQTDTKATLHKLAEHVLPHFSD